MSGAGTPDGVEVKVAGREVTPGDAKATERLNRYWTEGAGAAKIRWAIPGDFDRCVRLLGKYMHDPEQVKGHCANLHKRATGGWPGHAPGAEQAEAAAKKAEHKSVDTADDGIVTYGLDDLPPVRDALDLGDGRALCWTDDGSMFVTGEDDQLIEVHGPADDAELTVIPPSTKADTMSKTAGEVKVGDSVSVKGKDGTVTGKVTAIKARGPLIALTINGSSVWVPAKASVSITPETKGMFGAYLPGSVEQQQAVLQVALQQAMLPDADDDATSGSAPSSAYLSLDGTFADYVVCTVSDYSGPTTDRESYRVPYVVDDDGTVTLGEPEPVSLQTVIMPVGTDPVDAQGDKGDPDDDGDDDSAGGDDTDLAPVPMLALPDLATAVKAWHGLIENKAMPMTVSPSQAARLGAAHAHLCSVLGDLGLGATQLDTTDGSTAPDMAPDGTPALSDSDDWNALGMGDGKAKPPETKALVLQPWELAAIEAEIAEAYAAAAGGTLETKEFQFDEAKHPRLHGKFAAITSAADSREGVQGDKRYGTKADVAAGAERAVKAARDAKVEVPDAPKAGEASPADYTAHASAVHDAVKEAYNAEAAKPSPSLKDLKEAGVQAELHNRAMSRLMAKVPGGDPAKASSPGVSPGVARANARAEAAKQTEADEEARLAQARKEIGPHADEVAGKRFPDKPAHAKILADAMRYNAGYDGAEAIEKGEPEIHVNAESLGGLGRERRVTQTPGVRMADGSFAAASDPNTQTTRRFDGREKLHDTALRMTPKDTGGVPVRITTIGPGSSRTDHGLFVDRKPK